MTTLSILVRVCNFILGVYKLKALEVVMGSLGFILHIVAKLLWFCLSFFDAIVTWSPPQVALVRPCLVVFFLLLQLNFQFIRKNKQTNKQTNKQSCLHMSMWFLFFICYFLFWNGANNWRYWCFYSTRITQNTNKQLLTH
jgi:accessory gene regulator protein AgrB